MKLLAIDTSSLACSVALRSDDEVAERHEELPREHTRLLTPMIRDVLGSFSVSPQELDAVVLGNGPGSFIGMRIAASVAQGLAQGAGIPIAPVSSLAAVAVQVFSESAADEVVVTQDAHMGEVYLGAFRRGDDNLPIPMFPERLQAQTLIEDLDESAAQHRLSAGFGWQRYPALAAANETLFADDSGVLYPRASHLLTLGAGALARGEQVEPKDIVPAYLRSKVAEKPASVGS